MGRPQPRFSTSRRKKGILEVYERKKRVKDFLKRERSVSKETP